MSILYKDILMPVPEPLPQSDRERLLESLQMEPCLLLWIPKASVSREKTNRAISKAACLVSEITTLWKHTVSGYRTAGNHCQYRDQVIRCLVLNLSKKLKWELFSCSAETVADPASTTRDNQDTMSGEPPSDITTKDPFQDMTEQSFTYDYEDTTHSQAMDEEEGRKLKHLTDLVCTATMFWNVFTMIKMISMCVCRGPGAGGHHSHRYSSVPGSICPPCPHRYHTQEVHRLLEWKHPILCVSWVCLRDMSVQLWVSVSVFRFSPDS